MASGNDFETEKFSRQKILEELSLMSEFFSILESNFLQLIGEKFHVIASKFQSH